MCKAIFQSYDKKIEKKFKWFKNKMNKMMGKKLDIHHVGSTAIKIGGKNILDVVIGIKGWEEAKEIVKKLKQLGFKHFHRRKRKIFASTKKITGPGDIHVHIVKKNSKQYQNYLFFRDYLKRNKKARKEYEKIKEDLVKKGVSRKRYQEAKSKFIKEILRRKK